MSVDLFCLPFAGAHLDPFRTARAAWAEQVPGSTAVTLTYPGHGSRIGEPVLPTIARMAHDALDQVVEQRARTGSSAPIVLLGYSMGSLVAYELCHLLTDLGMPVAHLLAMAATPPAHVFGTGLDLDGDQNLLDHCEQYGIIDPASFPQGPLRDLFLPALRNDILAVDRYVGAVDGRRPLPADTGLSVFNGRHDVTVEHTAGWSDLTAEPVTFHDYDGGHFFLTERPDELTRDVARVLRSISERTLV